MRWRGNPGAANDSITGPAPPRGKSCNTMRDVERNPPTPAARIAANGTGRKMTLLARPRRGRPSGIRLAVAAAPTQPPRSRQPRAIAPPDKRPRATVRLVWIDPATHPRVCYRVGPGPRSTSRRACRSGPFSFSELSSPYGIDRLLDRVLKLLQTRPHDELGLPIALLFVVELLARFFGCDGDALECAVGLQLVPK